MVRQENIRSKISSLRKYLGKLQAYEGLSLDEIMQDDERRAAIERFLYLATQAGIDLAEMLVKLHAFGRPETMTECFHALLDQEYIPEELAGSLIRMVGFRNVLSHGYEFINYSIVRDALNFHVRDLESFVQIIEKTEGYEGEE